MQRVVAIMRRRGLGCQQNIASTALCTMLRDASTFGAATEPLLQRYDRNGGGNDRNYDRGGDRGNFNRGGDRGGDRSYDRGGDRGNDRGGDRNYDRGGDRNYDRGGDRSYDRGNDRGGDRNYDRGGDRGNDRGGDRNYDRGGDRGNDRGGDRNFNRGGDRNYDRGSDRGNDRGGDRGGDRSYDRGNDRGGDRNYDRGGSDRGGDRGNFNRGGNDRGADRSGDRGGYNRGGNDRNANDSKGSDRGGFNQDRRGGEPSPSSNRGIRDAQDRISESFGDSRRSGAAAPLERISIEVGAQKLLDLKKKYRNAHLKREKSSIEKEALLCLRQTRVDRSHQDEKSMAILLNCAVFFRASKRTFAVKDGIEWSMNNLKALSPQNTAKLCHAISALATVRGGQRKQLITEVANFIDKEFQLSAFSPVELIMIQQSFTRSGLTTNHEQQAKILADIQQRVPAMASSELSTVMDLITNEGHAEVLSKVQSLIASLAGAVAKKLSQEGVVGAIHSNNILHYLKAYVKLQSEGVYTLPADLWKALLERATAVARYFMDSQVGPALAVAADLKPMQVAPEALVSAFDDAVMARVKHIVGTFDLESAATLADGFAASRRAIPTDLLSVITTRLISTMAFQRTNLRELAKVTTSMHAAGVTDEAFFVAVANMVIGKRPDRPSTTAENAKPQVVFEFNLDASIEYVYRRLDYCITIRLLVEETLGHRASELMAPQLADVIIGAAKKTHPIQLLETCATILKAKQGIPGRNRRMDDEILNIATRRVAEQRALEVPSRNEEGNDNSENVAKMADAVEAFLAETAPVASGHPLLQAVQRAASNKHHHSQRR